VGQVRLRPFGAGAGKTVRESPGKRVADENRFRSRRPAPRPERLVFAIGSILKAKAQPHMNWNVFWRSLLAVLAGNALYFGIESHLPLWAQHQTFGMDAGLAVDFVICIACYQFARLLR
jgi:hypothetical protein